MTTRQREPRRRDRDYMGWVARLPCVACAVGGRAVFGVEVAHCGLAIAAHGWRGAGVQEKADDRRTLPLCPSHHRTGRDAEHNGQRQFWDRLGICPACLAQSLEACYESGTPGVDAIWSAVRSRRRDGGPTC